ncbi:MAG TPA: hypothetical protein VM536_06940, partial [Chloroflexia bacterium]|nr:hypothetical protein [Chloroflexia bacterium]
CGINSYTLAHLSHLNVLSAYLLPLGLLGLYHLFHPCPAGPSWRAAVGVAVVMVAQALSTFYILAFLLVAAAAYAGWQMIVRRVLWAWPAGWRRRLAVQLGAIAAVTAAGIGLIMPPYLETQQMLGFARSTTENQAWAARPVDYLSVSLHNRRYATVLPHNEPEPLFLGFCGLALVGVGLLVAAGRRRGQVPAGRAELGFYAALLAGGVLLTLGPQLDLGAVQVPLPYALLAALPGGSALRAPVRAMVLVNLAAGVFAGLGAGWLAAALAGRADQPHRAAPVLRAALLAVLGVLILAEQQVAPLGLTPLPGTQAAIPPVYRWLADHPDGGPLIELLIGNGLRDPAVEGRRMYYQTWHGHPLVNGYSSFRPPTYIEIMGALDREYATFTAEQLGILQSLGVRYMLYHQADYKTGAWHEVMAGLQRFPQVHQVGVFPTGSFGDDYLYAVDPRPPDVRLRVEPDPGAHAVRLHNPYSYPLLTRLRPKLLLHTGCAGDLAIDTPLVIPPGTSVVATQADSALPRSDRRVSTVVAPPAPEYLDLAPGLPCP